MKLGTRRYYVVITAVSAVAVAVISLLLLSSYRDATRTVKRQFADQQAILGRQTAFGIEEVVERLARELEILSRRPAIQRIDPVAGRAVMEETFAYVSHLYVNDISRTDADGVVRITLNSPNLVGANFSHREYFKRVRALRTSSPAYEFITFQGAKKGQKGIIVAMPVFQPDGSFAGPVLFVVEVSDLLKGLLPPRTDVRRSWVVDKDGVVLFHPDHPPGTIIESLPRRDPVFGDFLRSLTKGEERQAEYVTESGRLVIAAATPVRVADQTWSVVTETREDAIRGILMRFNAQHLLANLIAVVMIIGSALGILRLVTRWNSQLKDEIAERARTEEELRFREESYRSLVENSPS